jgi:ribonuclease VapC
VIVDTSAIVALVLDEDDSPSIAAVLASADDVRMSAASWLEAAVVLDGRRNPATSRQFDDLVAAIGLTVEPVTAAQAAEARRAYWHFGRGSGHPARLNFGDCFAYALARTTGQPLLFKGDDFGHTDVAPAG